MASLALSKVFWRSINFSSLKIEEWGGEFTVFQPDSGKTHFLNQMGMQILYDLDKYSVLPVTEEEICERLAVKFHLQLNLRFSEQVSKTLNRFRELGLVEQVKQDRSCDC